MAPDDENAQLGVYYSESVVVHGQVRFYKKVYPTTSFIIDHPVYGDIDSSTLALDGGYLAGSESVPHFIGNDGDRWVEHGQSLTYIDTDNTSATVDTSTYTITF